MQMSNAVSIFEHGVDASERLLRAEFQQMFNFDTEVDPLVQVREAAQVSQAYTLEYLGKFGLEGFIGSYLDEPRTREKRSVRVMPTRSVAEPDMSVVHPRTELPDEYEDADHLEADEKTRTYIRPHFFGRFQRVILAASGLGDEELSLDYRQVALEAGLTYAYSHNFMTVLIDELLQKEAGKDDKKNLYFLEQLLNSSLRTYVRDEEALRSADEDFCYIYRTTGVPHRIAGRIAYEHLAQQFVAGGVSEDNIPRFFRAMLEDRINSLADARTQGMTANPTDIGMTKPFADEECQGVLQGLSFAFKNAKMFRSI